MTYPSTNLFIAAPGNQILLSSRFVCLFSGEAGAADEEEITDFLYDYASRFGEKFCLVFRGSRGSDGIRGARRGALPITSDAEAPEAAEISARRRKKEMEGLPRASRLRSFAGTPVQLNQDK